MKIDEKGEMMAALVRLSTHAQAHNLHALNQGRIGSLGEGYQRGVQGPRGHLRSQSLFYGRKMFGIC